VGSTISPGRSWGRSTGIEFPEPGKEVRQGDALFTVVRGNRKIDFVAPSTGGWSPSGTMPPAHPCPWTTRTGRVLPHPGPDDMARNAPELKTAAEAPAGSNGNWRACTSSSACTGPPWRSARRCGRRRVRRGDRRQDRRAALQRVRAEFPAIRRSRHGRFLVRGHLRDEGDRVHHRHGFPRGLHLLLAVPEPRVPAPAEASVRPRSFVDYFRVPTGISSTRGTPGSGRKGVRWSPWGWTISPRRCWAGSTRWACPTPGPV